MYTLSIVIVSKNRYDQLEKTVAGIRLQHLQPLEIIIIDDSDNPESINANQSLAQKYNCIYLPSSGKGLFVNRNLGALYSKGTHIRSMDDDHELPEHHLEICMQAIKAEPETIWTIGEYTTSQKIHDAPHPIPGQLHPRGFAFQKYRQNEYYGIADGTSIYPRSVVNRKILNCEYYSFGLTYLEYGARLKYENYTLRPLTDTYVIHHSIVKSASTIPDIMQESRIFAMLCLSFKYQQTLYNKAATTFQLLLDILRGRTRLLFIKNAYKNYKKFTTQI